MSANTIKLSGIGGDIYIAPQGNTTYKDKLELFGYGYLDWGRVVNQSLVTLYDMIDTIQDSGTSEFTFQLEAYEKDQDNKRTDEFNIWKTEFKKLLGTMVDDYTNTVNETVRTFKEEQTNLLTQFKDSTSQEIQEINDKILEINEGFDVAVKTIVNSMMEATLKTVNSLKTDITQAINDLKDAKSSMDDAINKMENTVSTFKKGFEDSFEKFKEDTTKALEENKNYIIEYINGKIKSMLSITNNLDSRLMNIELIADTLSPLSLGEAIRNQVNQLASALLNNYLTDFINKMTRLEQIVNNLNDNIDNIIDDALVLKLKPIETKITSISLTLSQHSTAITNLTTIYTQLKTWQDFFEGKINASYKDKENFWNMLEKNFFSSAEALNILESIEIRNRLKFKTILEKVIEQNDKNTTNLINGFHEKITSILNGLSSTEFNELSLIKNFSVFETIKTQQNTSLNLVLGDIDNDQVSITEFSINPDAENLKLAFKLPVSFVNNGTNFDIEISRLSSTDSVLKTYTQEVRIVNDHVWITPNSNLFFGYPPSHFKVSKMDIVWYSKRFNCSNVIQINELILDINDKISIKVTNTSGTEITRVIKINDVYDLSDYSAEIDNNIKKYLYNVNEDLTPATTSILNAPVQPTINYANINTKILIPINKIVTTQTDTKELCIKIGLPNGATLTNISFNDGFANQTKTFSNEAKFPLSKMEYDSRSLSTKNNYYLDICSTGVIYFPINTSAKTVKTIITYVISGTTKTETVTTAGAGAGIDLGNFELKYDSVNDDLDLSYQGTTKFSFNKDGEFTAVANVWAYSDKTLKENIEIFERDIDLNKIETYLFNYIGNEQINIGFMAQDIQEQLPELVALDKDQKLKLNYDGMIAVMFSLLKKSKAKEKELEERLLKIENLLNL